MLKKRGSTIFFYPTEEMYLFLIVLHHPKSIGSRVGGNMQPVSAEFMNLHIKDNDIMGGASRK